MRYHDPRQDALAEANRRLHEQNIEALNRAWFGPRPPPPNVCLAIAITCLVLSLGLVAACAYGIIKIGVFP